MVRIQLLWAPLTLLLIAGSVAAAPTAYPARGPLSQAEAASAFGDISDASRLVEKFLSSVTDDGAKCMVCQAVLGILQSKALISGRPGRDHLAEMCDRSQDFFFKTICGIALEGYEKALELTEAGFNPDAACVKEEFCLADQHFPLWNVWPPVGISPKHVNASTRHLLDSKHSSPLSEDELRLLMASRPPNDSPNRGDFFEDISNLIHLIFGDFSDNIDRVFKRKRPIADLDNDGFAFLRGLRGSYWRGLDCEDTDATVYPGRKLTDHGVDMDHNCNGIVGADPATGRSWEDELCKGTDQVGIAAFGDSATAHFALPPQWITPRLMNFSSFDSIVTTLINEADWPECSLATGFDNPAQCPGSIVPMDSLYLRLRERNRCSHRDFQNIGVNGANSKQFRNDSLQFLSLSRDRARDQPLLVIMAMIGNDVCSSHTDTTRMTQPAEFRENVVSGLRHLDATLPKGSHVVMVPLAPGKLLYEIMHKEQHPLGPTYTSLYDWLNYNSKSPCAGWLNSDAGIRQATQDHADKLSNEYTTIVNMRFSNIDTALLPSNYFTTIMERYSAMGGKLPDLIEPADGFHPSVTAARLMSRFIWEFLEKSHPKFLGGVNPNNAKIDALFGDQGGHLP